MDYTGSIYHMKFDMVVNAVRLAVASAVSALLADTHNISEILHSQTATSQSFVLMAQVRVRITQWPLFKPTFKLKVYCQWK